VSTTAPGRRDLQWAVDKLGQLTEDPSRTAVKSNAAPAVFVADLQSCGYRPGRP
jgi:hypothetical protein